MLEGIIDGMRHNGGMGKKRWHRRKLKGIGGGGGDIWMILSGGGGMGVTGGHRWAQDPGKTQSIG